MSYRVVVITHGMIGTSIVECCKAIYKDSPKEIDIIEVHPDEQPEPIEKRLNEILDGYGNDEDILIITDIIGATPCNIATRAAKNRNAKIISGINIQIMLKIFNYADISLDEISERVIKAGINGISIVDLEKE